MKIYTIVACDHCGNFYPRSYRTFEEAQEHFIKQVARYLKRCLKEWGETVPELWGRDLIEYCVTNYKFVKAIDGRSAVIDFPDDQIHVDIIDTNLKFRFPKGLPA